MSWNRNQLDGALGVWRAPRFALAHALGLALLVPSSAAVASTPTVQAASASARKVLPIEISGRWNTLKGEQLSPNGQWMSYVRTTLDDERVLHIQSLNGPTRYEIQGGSSLSGLSSIPVFSEDSKWATYFVSTAPGNDQPAVRRFELLALDSGKRFEWTGVTNYRLSNDSRWLALQLGNPGNAGKALMLRDLTTAAERKLEQVDAYGFDTQNRFIVYTVDIPEYAGNGVYLLELATGRTRTLAMGPQSYGGFVWSEQGKRLVVVRRQFVPRTDGQGEALLVWWSLGEKNEQALEWNPAQRSDFPSDEVLSDSAPVWSDEGTRLIVSLKARSMQDSAPPPKGARVTIWHWKEDFLPPAERTDFDRYALLDLGVLHLSTGRFVPIQAPAKKIVSRDARWVIVLDDYPYRENRSGHRPYDVYCVSTETGERSLIVRQVSPLDQASTFNFDSPQALSPDSQWYVYRDSDGRLYSYHLSSGRRKSLDAPAEIWTTEGNGAFVIGSPRWAKDSQSILLYGPCDIWSVPLNGSKATNITHGVGQARQIAFRFQGTTYATLALNEGFSISSEPIDLSQPVVVGAIGKHTKQSGYWRLEAGRAPQPLIWEDRLFGAYKKAKFADRVIFTRQSFEEFPNYWVSSTQFKLPRRISDANPDFLKQYAWGRNVLIDFTLESGQQLHAVLTLPANYESGNRYPMIVSQYQMLSDELHQFSMPYSQRGIRPIPSVYASHGYMMLRPDIPQIGNRPGSIALECVTAAVKRAIELGYADPQHIGLHGHSFGGYHSAYIVTQTNLFAAAVVGAGIADLVAFEYSDTYVPWRAEHAQFQLSLPYWEDPNRWLSQSPIHHANKIRTPMLIYAGEQDDIVDWRQEVELFRAAWRNYKPAIMLAYSEEGHGIVRRENVNDYQLRMKQFYDHYLMDKPAPGWIANGAP